MAISLIKRVANLFARKALPQLSAVSSRGGWINLIRESYAGAWQRNVTVEQEDILSNWAVFSCMTLIAGDMSKMRLRLMEEHGNYRTETISPAFSPVLRKPNHFQTRQQFVEYWVLAKLSHGNSYCLKQRDARGVVVSGYILNPPAVTPLVTPSGDVYYRLKRDELSKVMTEDVVVPASEIMHDRMNCLFHPLVGLSPLYAAWLAANQGLRIQKNSEDFFANFSQPGGILTAPEEVSDENAARLKEYFEENYQGTNAGRIAVLGDGLKYEPMTVNANDAQLIEQLKWSAEAICAPFHVPPYMIGIGAMPSYQNVEVLSQQYYSQCLQTLIEAFESVWDEGLSLPSAYSTNMDLRGLLRMDTSTRYKAYAEALGAGWMKPDEVRASEDYAPIEGGNTAYMQQQNFSLAALARRDRQENPFATNPTSPTPPAVQAPAQEPDDSQDELMEFLELVNKGLPELELE